MAYYRKSKLARSFRYRTKIDPYIRSKGFLLSEAILALTIICFFLPFFLMIYQTFNNDIYHNTVKNQIIMRTLSSFLVLKDELRYAKDIKYVNLQSIICEFPNNTKVSYTFKNGQLIRQIAHDSAKFQGWGIIISDIKDLIFQPLTKGFLIKLTLLDIKRRMDVPFQMAFTIGGYTLAQESIFT